MYCRLESFVLLKIKSILESMNVDDYLSEIQISKNVSRSTICFFLSHFLTKSFIFILIESGI